MTLFDGNGQKNGVRPKTGVLLVGHVVLRSRISMTSTDPKRKATEDDSVNLKDLAALLKKEKEALV